MTEWREWIVTSAEIGCDGVVLNYPELIRFRDCKHFEHNMDCFDDCTLDGGYQYTVYTTVYCSHGERKEE